MAEAIEPAVVNGHRDAQRVVRRGQKREWQHGETGASPAESFNAGLAVTRLEITLRTHVVIDPVQVIVEFLAMQNVLLADAREQPGLFDVLHLTAQGAALENLASFKANLGDAHTFAFIDPEDDGHGS